MSRGTNVADIYAEMRLRDRGFSRNLKQADKSIQNTNMNIFKMQSILTKVGLTLGTGVIVKGLIDIGRASTNLAGDMIEVENVFNVFLGARSKEFLKRADEIGQAVGRSSYMTRQFTSQALSSAKSMGVFGQALGETSLEISKMAFDLASLYNTSDEQAMNALRSGLMGEAEPLRRYGILISANAVSASKYAQELGKTQEQMTETEKVQARWNYILENSKQAQGDATRTADDYKNAVKSLQGELENVRTKIGESMVEPMNTAVVAMRDMLRLLQQNEFKLNVDESSFTTFAKLSAGLIADFFKLQYQISDKVIVPVLGGILEGMERTLGTLIRIPKDFVMQGQRAKEIREKPVFDASFEAWDAIHAPLREDKAKQEEMAQEKIAEADSYISNIQKKLENIEMISEKTGLDALDEKLQFITKEYRDKLEDANLNEGIEKFLESQFIDLSNQKLVFEYENEVEKLLKEIAKEKEERLEKERQNIEKEKKNQAERANDIELEKKSLKAQEELEKTKRKLYYDELNNIQDLKNEFLGVEHTTEALTQKYLELNNAGTLTEEQLLVLDMVFKEFADSVEETKEASKDYTKSLSQVAQITSELSDIFKDDLLNSMAMVMNQASSMMTNWQMGGLSQGLAVVQGVGITTSLMREWNKDDRAERQAEDYKRFEEAVKNFERAVNDLSVGGAINFAQLEKPTNLTEPSVVEGSAGNQGVAQTLTTGGLNVAFGKKPKDASLDTSELQKQLDEAGYGEIDVDAVAEKHKIYGSTRDWKGKKKSYVKGYDTVAMMEEINELIEQAYRLNLDNFKEAVGLTSQNFSKGLEQAFIDNGDAQKAMNDIMTNAMITAVFHSQAFEEAGKILGDSFAEEFFDNFEDFDIGDFANLSLEEQMQMYIQMFEEGSSYLEEQFERLGLQLDRTTDDLNSLSGSTKNLPQGFKMAQAVNQSSNSTTIQIYGDMYGDDIQKKIIQGLQYDQGLATGNYTRM